MEGKVAIYFIGTAGCGKSTMTAAFQQMLLENGMTAQTLNLDPGADSLPFEPDIDVREWITLGDVMEEYGLGPNGAQVVAADMLALYKGRVLEEIEKRNFQYLLIDTPGQLELFSFREATKEVVHGIRPEASYIVYMIDPFNARTPSGYMSQLMLSNLTKLRFNIPSIEVISKYDMLDPKVKENLDRWQEFPDQLLGDLVEEGSHSTNMGTELAIGLFKSMEDLSIFSKHIPASSASGDGLEDIIKKVQITYGDGEDPSDND